jgi:hypothetical protein
MTLGARLVIQSAARGRREVPVPDFFVKDGIYNKTLQPDELLTHVIVPPPQPGLRSAYAKLRPRDSIDFPRSAWRWPTAWAARKAPRRWRAKRSSPTARRRHGAGRRAAGAAQGRRAGRGRRARR